MKQRVLEGTWEEIALHAKELSGRRVRITVLDEEEAPMLDQTLSNLIKAAEALELEGQQLTPSNLAKDTGKAFIDIVVEKYKKQGFNL